MSIIHQQEQQKKDPVKGIKNKLHTRREYLQTTYLAKDLYLEYIF